MQHRKVDVAIIGAGTAGLAAYQATKAHTESVALIERGPAGTTCARVGCMPSKLLIAAANAAQHTRHVERFGIDIDGTVRIDGEAVMTRVRSERDYFVGHVLDSMARIPEQDKYRGHARFADANTLVIDDQIRLEAERIIIATGSRPTIPEPFQLAGDRLVTSDTLFEWATLPESVVVFGPGTTGLELAQALARLGVRVRLFGRHGSLGILSDDVVRKEAERIFNEEFYVDTQGDAKIIERDNHQVIVSFTERSTGNTLTERFDYALIATGRQPNIDALDLLNAGLKLDDKGMPSFDRYTMRCRNTDGQLSHIFIAGDVDNESPVLHEATDEGRIAGDNAGRFDSVYSSHRRSPLSIVFSDPQIARIGLSHAELSARYGDKNVAISEYSFDNQGRARVMGINKGFLRLYGEYGSGHFLGAEICMPQGEHIAHLLAWAHQQRMSVTQMLSMPYYHPTLEEGLRTALRDLSTRLLLDAALVEQCMECGPGA
ncbi:dihydrolipoyl dehydrogenase [Phytohalomonas tamaricis]|uniref:dihydrolipoyl dehydrogenase n=1 Tax=Phytohalomonas tamaricis TaxID=2081032 RepID=UPI000D0BE59C|nr:dihydrolipoyl dehydrogenase [Phytohalomonas tamaricis]